MFNFIKNLVVKIKDHFEHKRLLKKIRKEDPFIYK
jgi:hypothetical protein